MMSIQNKVCIAESDCTVVKIVPLGVLSSGRFEPVQNQFLK